EEHVVRAAEGALELGLREQRADLRLAARRDQGQPIERAGEHAAVDQLQPGVAVPARDLEARLLEGAREPDAAPFTVRGAVAERLDRNRAEFRVDRARQ